MATNLVFAAGTDPNMDENRYYMIWQSILNHQFRIDKWYGVGFETSLTSAGTKRDLFIVKALGAQEHVVLVADVKKPLEETEQGKEAVIKELVDYIEEQFDHDETKFPSIYGLATSVDPKQWPLG